MDHALAAADLENAARLVEENFRDMLAYGEPTSLLNWIAALPEELLRSRPRLCIPCAWARVLTGQLGAAELCVQDLERMIDANVSVPPHEREAPTSNEELAAVSDEAAAIQAFIVRTRGDVSRPLELSRRALGLLLEDNFTLRGIVALNLGGAYLMSGDLAAADAAITEAITASRRASNAFGVLLVMRELAGLLSDGRAPAPGSRPLPIGTPARRAAAVSCWEFGARGNGRAALRMERPRRCDAPSDGRHRTGRAKREHEHRLPRPCPLGAGKVGTGDLEGAFRIIQEDEWSAHSMNLSSQDLNRIIAYGARLRLAQRDVGAASRLLGERGIGVDDNVNHLNVFEHVMLARVLVVRDEHGAAVSEGFKRRVQLLTWRTQP